jgi:hypothetical protein
VAGGGQQQRQRRQRQRQSCSPACVPGGDQHHTQFQQRVEQHRQRQDGARQTGGDTAARQSAQGDDGSIDIHRTGQRQRYGHPAAAKSHLHPLDDQLHKRHQHRKAQRRQQGKGVARWCVAGRGHGGAAGEQPGQQQRHQRRWPHHAC